MPACSMARGSSENLSAMALKRGGSTVPESSQLRLICFALITGMMPGITGTWMPAASTRYRKL